MKRPQNNLLISHLVLMTALTINPVYAEKTLIQMGSVNKAKPTVSTQSKAKPKQTISSIKSIPNKTGSGLTKTKNNLKQQKIKQKNITPKRPTATQQPLLQKKLSSKNLAKGQKDLNGMKELNGFKLLNPSDAMKQPSITRPMQRKGNTGNANQPSNNSTGRGEVTNTGTNMQRNPFSPQKNTNNPSITSPLGADSSTSPNATGSIGADSNASPSNTGNIPPARPSTSAAGEESYVLSNGRHVSRNSVGSEGQPNDNGGVTYSDGRRAEPGPKGTTIFYNPDGSVQHTEGAVQEATPSHSSTDQDTFTLSNGQQVPATTRGDDQGTADSSGGVTYQSGRRIFVDPETNETVSTNPNGSEHSRDPAPSVISEAKQRTSSTGQATYELSNGQQVPATLGEGDAGTPDNEGGVTYESGRRIYADPNTGETVGTNPDGSERSRDPAPAGNTITGSDAPATPPNNGGTVGATSDGVPSYKLSNGQHVPSTNEDGSPAQVNPDGSVTYTRVGEDGQIEKSTMGVTEDGMTVTVRDGEMVFRLAPGSQNDTGSVDHIESNPLTYGSGGDFRGGTRINHGVGGNPDTATMDNGGIFDLSKGDQVRADGSIVHGATGDVYSTDPETGETVITREDGTEDRKQPPGQGSTNNNNNSSGKNDGSSNEDNSDNNEESGGDESGDGDSGDEGSGGDDTGGEESGGDDTGEEGATEYREGGSNYNRAPGAKVVDDFVAKKTGQKRDVETGTPPPCGEDDGSGPVAEPGPEGEAPCAPPIGNSEEEEGEAPPPTAEDYVRARDHRSTSIGQESVVNPSRFEDNRPDNNQAQDTLNSIGDAVNPGR